MNHDEQAWLAQLRISRLRLAYRPLSSWKLGPQPSVMYRGALGRALMDLVCVHHDRDCGACRLRRGCMVADWYDPGLAGETGPRPFVLAAATAAGSSLGPAAPFAMNLTLVSPCPRPSGLIEAAVRAGRRGLGSRRVPHILERISAWVNGAWRDVLVDERRVRPWPDPRPIDEMTQLPDYPAGARIVLESPLQLKRRERPSPPEVVNAAVQRVRTVARMQGLTLDRWWPDVQGLPGGWEGLTYARGKRFSRAQDANVDLSGWLGSLHLGPEAGSYADVLAAASLLQIGRKTSAGLGRLSLTWK